MGSRKLDQIIVDKFPNAHLHEISMLSCEVETIPESMAAGPKKGPLRFTASAKVKGFLATDGGLPVGMYTRFELEIFQARKPTKRDPSTKTDLARVSVGYAAYFSVPSINTEEITESECDQFALGEGIRLIQPYIQQHVSDMTGRIGFPPLLLPNHAIDTEIYNELDS